MNKLLNAVREKVSRKVLAVSVAVAGVVAAPAAFAVDPPGLPGAGSTDPIELARQGFNTLNTTYISMSGDAWKYVVGVVVGFAVMGLFKKFVSKAH